MTRFDWKDFTKSALSLASGMAAVIGFVFWHSGGDMTAIWLTAGLPAGVLSFWAVYGLRVSLIERREAFFHEAPKLARPEELNNIMRPENSLERRTVKSLNNNVDPTRSRILQGRQPVVNGQDASQLDQWHQG